MSIPELAPVICLENLDLQRLPSHFPHATIRIREHATTLRFEIYERTFDSGPRCARKPKTKLPNASQIWDDLAPCLEQMDNRGTLSQNKWEDIWMQLEGIGADLMAACIPRELQQIISTWPEGSVIILDTDEFWIPWELFFDEATESFWASKFIIARQPVLAYNVKEIQEPQRPTHPSTRLSKAVNIVGGNIGRSWHSKIENVLGCLPQSVSVHFFSGEQYSVSQIREILCESDIINLTCHGHAKPRPCLQIGSDDPNTNAGVHSCVYPTTVKRFRDLHHSVVLANACSSASPSDFLGQTRSFGWEFYCKGVDAYIGTLAAVPTDYAIDFSKYFYDHLARRNETVGESLHHARRDAAGNNPFWLFYCLYGDPFSRKCATTYEPGSTLDG